MGLGEADLLDDRDAAGGGKASSSIPCSICLEDVTDYADRAWAKLQCGHQFHLDCIGSAFNVKGAMQCPNCRRIQKGRWQPYSESVEEGGPVESDLTGILRRQSESDLVTRSEFNAFKDQICSSFDSVTELINSFTNSIQQSMTSLSERIKILENTRKTEAGSSKHKHDDEDDPNHHEREKKRQKLSDDMVVNVLDKK